MTTPIHTHLSEIARQVATISGVESATVEQPGCIHIHFPGGAAIVAGVASGVWATDHYHDAGMTAPVGDAESTLPPDAEPAAVVAFIAKAIRGFFGTALLRGEPAAGLPQFINGKQFAEEMGARGMLYHIEDSPFEIEHDGGKRTFTDEQAELLKELCDTLTDEEAEEYFSRAVAFNNAQPAEPAAPAEDPASLPALMELFPTLARLAPTARADHWTSYGLLKVAQDMGSGAAFAAKFIDCALSGGLFPLRDALAKWDSKHRAGWVEASRRLARA